MDRRKLLQLGSLAAAGVFMPLGSKGLVLNKAVQTKASEFDRIRLNANENPYGPSENVKKAITESLLMSNRYPHVDSIPRLKSEIAKLHGVTEDMILITAGSYQALKIIGTRLSNGKGNHVAPDLSFTVLMRQTERMGCTWKKIKTNDDKSINLKRMRDAVDSETQFVYITNPNNPTGHYISRDKIVDFCRSIPSELPIIVDEAYIEFVKGDESESVVGLLQELPNLIITRTFSKIYGLAGLRIGYALAKPEWIEDWSTWDQGGQLGVSNLSANAAIAALQDHKFLKSSKVNIDKTRNQFSKELTDLGIKVYPSWTNFMLLESGNFQERLIPKLEQAKIDIGIGRSGVMTNLTRVSVGTDQQMNQLLNLIKSVI